MFASVSDVAATTRKQPSRSSGTYRRRRGELGDLGIGLGGHHHHLCVTREQALDLLEPDGPRPHDQTSAARQVERGHIEVGLHHAGDAGLVAEPTPELADARLSLVAHSFKTKTG